MEDRLFAIGDIHGCFSSFRTLLEQKIGITKNDKLILLGDYIDRGAESKEVIDLIMDLKERGFDIVPLCGNHEAMLLDAYYHPEFLSIWLQNGGDETLKSFDIGSPGELEYRYVVFLSNLIYYYEYGDYLFVHAGFNDISDNPFADKYSMIWRCRSTYRNENLKFRTVIHGHNVIPFAVCSELVKNHSNVIGIDTGCVFSEYEGYGVLTALEVKTRSLYFA